MMWESFHPESIDEKSATFTFGILIGEAVATSIDALSAGISLLYLPTSIWVSAFIIFAVTTLICLFGHLIGRKLGLLLKDNAVFLGGFILFLIGLKTLLEHLEIL